MIMNCRTMRLATATIVASVVLSGNAAQAADVSQSAVIKARRFLESQPTAEYVLSFLHMGSTYRSHSLAGISRVRDRFGNMLPGEFALVYDFSWDAAGVGNTRVAFLCDSEGKVEDVQAIRTDAILQQPFKFANATVQLLGTAIVEAFGDEMTADDLRMVQRFVSEVCSEGLLEMGLSIRQSINMR